MAIVPWSALRTLPDGHRERDTVRAPPALAIAQHERSPISQVERQQARASMTDCDGRK